MDILPSPQQLRYLITLFELRHFGRAANTCSVTQSTLSAGILNLERQLDVAILDRTAGKRVIFTAVGEEIVAQSRLALQGLESVRKVVTSAQEPFSSSLKLGIIPTISPYLLPSIIQEIKNTFPKLNLSIHEDLTENLMEKLSIGFLDLLVIAMPCSCDGAETYALFQDDFYLIMPKGHELESFDSVPLERVNADEVIFLQGGHCLRDQTLDMCRQVQSFKTVHDASNKYLASSLKTVVTMVQMGLGVAFIPKMALINELADHDNIVARLLSGQPSWRTIGLAWRRNSLRSSEFKKLETIFHTIKS